MCIAVKCVIFDLDGTLLDTSPGILESVQYATETLGYPELLTEQLLSFIGPPLPDSFIRCYGCDRAEAEHLTAVYREHYREGALLNATPYEGIYALCQELKKHGTRLSVATSKPQFFAQQILTSFGFDRYLDEIHGADFEGKLSKTDLIRLCVGEDAPAECLMVGDTEHDAKGAQAAGVPFLAVSYGFGDLHKMVRYPHIGISDTPLGVLKVLHEREVN